MCRLRHFFAAPAAIFSIVLSTAHLPTAHASTIENLVFTESSSTQLAETLNGVAIGSWESTGSYADVNTSTYGNLTAQPGGVQNQYAFLQFADPINTGDTVFLSLVGIFHNSSSEVVGDITPLEAAYFAPFLIIYPYPDNPFSTLPFSLTDATVNTPDGAVDVNITFLGPGAQVPDAAPTGGLLLLAGGALVVAHRRSRLA